MNLFKKRILSIFKKSKIKDDESGATMIEYGLIAALVAVVLIGALNSLENELTATFTGVTNALNTANTAG